MKHHAVGRPVGRCRGCCLNMRTMCAAGLEPRTEWSKGRCKDRDNASVLEAYYQPVPLTGTRAAKLARRTKAVQTATKPHLNGRKSLGGYVPADHQRA